MKYEIFNTKILNTKLGKAKPRAKGKAGKQALANTGQKDII